ncbi:MAG: hypothetical protein IJW99_10370 [Clostridia bacterium]|nr:hypothetical protein [Clostridia bacterium]
MFLSYLEKRMRRHMREVFFSMLTVAVTVLLLLGLFHYRTAQQKKLDDVYDHFEIRCTVTNISGSRKTDLDIAAGYLGLFEEGGTLFPHVKDVFLLQQLSGAKLLPSQDSDAAAGNVISLYMTNDPQASAYLEDAIIRYENGYDSESFRGGEAVCIVTESLSDRIGADGTVRLHSSAGETVARVVGTYLGEKDTVFISWQPMVAQLARKDIRATANSMSFTISDNRRLGEVKQLLRDYFVPASYTNKVSNTHGLIIDDNLFIDTVVVLERSLALLGVVRWLVYILSVGISFLIAFLGIRGRRLELAVMRSLGTRRIALYAEVLCEHLLIFLPGAAVAYWMSNLFGMSLAANGLGTVGAYMICYLLGVAFAVAQVTSGNIMQTLKGKE